MLSNANIPYWRLSGFYFFYFAFLGAWVPFWNLYLESELHFSASQIGILSALVLGTKIIGPYLWGWLSDHFGKRIEIIRVGAFFAFVIFFAVFWRQDFWALFFIVAVYSFFLNAVF
jgi:PPP family 3-phenylpropionic acid transporter